MSPFAHVVRPRLSPPAMPLAPLVLLWAALGLAACGASSPGDGASGAPGGAEGEAEERAAPESYDEALARLGALAEHPLVLDQTDTVPQLIEGGQVAATAAVQETVDIVRLFDHVIRENGERWRGRCLVGVAAANRALAVHIRGLQYQLPRDLEAQLAALVAGGAVDEAELAREEFQHSVTTALEERAHPLDCNERVALLGALSASMEWPDPDMDTTILEARIEELPECP